MNVWRRAWSALSWYIREFLGDNAYDKYLVRHHLAHTAWRAVGVDHAPLSRREFYRRLADAASVRGCC
ncbi:MAG: putative selenoprotein [Bifidobacteriaceae bacterium]|jgi:hypothetical protein|nr:putative selenoprotein [Bifidobacteriaceae bacterium]